MTKNIILINFRKDTYMDEIKGSTPSSADEMVQTLDGRIVNKKSIKNGEIYINSQGKKVRKVIKKVVRSTANAGGNTLGGEKQNPENK